MALTYTPSPDLGKSCPDFSLPSAQGGNFGKQNLPAGRPFVIMFICNHCPYVQAIEDRLIQLGQDLKNLQVPLIGISSNDAEAYPADSFEAMKERAQKKNYSFPYLYDESQNVAKEFGAVCTPDFFVYDQEGRLAYRGRLDDSWKEPQKVTKRELYEAVLALSKGQSAPEQQAPSMGCSLKWKKS